VRAERFPGIFLCMTFGLLFSIVEISCFYARYPDRDCSVDE